MIYCGMISIQITNMEDAVMSEEIKELNNEELNDIAGGTDTDVCDKCRQPLSKHGWQNNKRVFRHTVVWGDTLADLATRYNTTVAQIQRWNNIAEAHKIYVGQPLTVCLI